MPESWPVYSSPLLDCNLSLSNLMEDLWVDNKSILVWGDHNKTCIGEYQGGRGIRYNIKVGFDSKFLHGWVIEKVWFPFFSGCVSKENTTMNNANGRKVSISLKIYTQYFSNIYVPDFVIVTTFICYRTWWEYFSIQLMLTILLTDCNLSNREFLC